MPLLSCSIIVEVNKIKHIIIIRNRGISSLLDFLHKYMKFTLDEKLWIGCLNLKINVFYFKIRNYCGRKISRFCGWDLKSTKLKGGQKYFFRSNAKLKCHKRNLQKVIYEKSLSKLEMFLQKQDFHIEMNEIK